MCHAAARPDATAIASGFAGGFAWSAIGGSGKLVPKTEGNPAMTGVGVGGGRTPGEIDIGETLLGRSGGPPGVRIDAIVFGLLHDGHEFDDVREIARVEGAAMDGTALARTLTASGETFAAWSGASGVANLSPARLSSAGAWRVDSPFGAAVLGDIAFTALPNDSRPMPVEVCIQSDFVLLGLEIASSAGGGCGPAATPVPAPEGTAVLTVAALALAAVRRRTGAAPA